MFVSTLLLLFAMVLMVGALPTWPHSKNWGYYPSGGASLAFIAILVLIATGRI